MSIIYDALKKLERSNNQVKNDTGSQQPQAEPRKKRSILYPIVFSLVLAASGLFLGVKLYDISSKDGGIFVKLNKPLSELNSFKETLLKEVPLEKAAIPGLPQTAPGLGLSGVFFSDQEGYAIINGQIVRVGDEVEGSIVKSISVDEVELERAGVTTKISNKLP